MKAAARQPESLKSFESLAQALKARAKAERAEAERRAREAAAERARQQALERERQAFALAVGPVQLMLDSREVTVGGAEIHLTGKEHAILELLMLRKGIVLTKEMFLNHLYGGMDEPELKIIDVFICKLRKKLAHATIGKNYIETVWGRGYVLRENGDAPGMTTLELRQSA